MKKVLGYGFLAVITIALVMFLLLSIGLGALNVYYWGRERVNQFLEDVRTSFTSFEVVEKIKEVEKEPDWGPGIEGKIRRRAKEARVPVAIAFSVGAQEGGLKEHNLQINCPAKFAGKSNRHLYCAYGLFQLIPAFNDIDDPRTIWGPENLDENIRQGLARLRRDYDLSRGKSERERWYNALIKYYGAEQDNYQRDVLARAVEMALKYG